MAYLVNEKCLKKINNKNYPANNFNFDNTKNKQLYIKFNQYKQNGFKEKGFEKKITILLKYTKKII